MGGVGLFIGPYRWHSEVTAGRLGGTYVMQGWNLGSNPGPSGSAACKANESRASKNPRAPSAPGSKMLLDPLRHCIKAAILSLLPAWAPREPSRELSTPFIHHRSVKLQWQALRTQASRAPCTSRRQAWCSCGLLLWSWGGGGGVAGEGGIVGVACKKSVIPWRKAGTPGIATVMVGKTMPGSPAPGPVGPSRFPRS